ncbi:hypothetical protein LBMAG56_14480 [Verrucomicrobiota bacterium]|nr:hypothetical protein LBMAG56_14480 [Verrucomicrobiota bacterium]
MSNAPKTAGVTPQSPLIFVVDDEPLICEVLEIALTQGGFRVQIFTNPQAAADAFEDAITKPNLLATDFAMPGMDGLELIRQCRVVSPALRTILFSGNLTLEMLTFEKVRPDKFINKPFIPSKFVEEVSLLLGGPGR